jgi:hypothetical protein
MSEQVYNLHVQFLLGPASTVALGSKSHRTRDHILLSCLRLGSLFVTSCNSEDCGGSIITCLHMGYQTLPWGFVVKLLSTISRPAYLGVGLSLRAHDVILLFLLI